MPTNRQFSILLLGTQMELGGAQQVLLTQARWFHRHGHQVQAVFFYDKQNLASRWEREHPFKVIQLDAWKSGRFWIFNIPLFLRGLWRLARLLKHVQIIETFTTHSNLLGLPVAWLKGVPVRLGTLHGFFPSPFGILSRLHGLLSNSAIVSKLIVVSKEVEQVALDEGVRREKIHLIQNGIDLDTGELTTAQRKALRAQASVEDGTILLIAVGRLAPVKGHADLLRALRALPQPRPHLVVLGEGELRSQLQDLAAGLGLAERVRFLGNQPEARRWLAAADIYVQPSLSEGLSIALLEAMASGLPIVATRVGAAGKLIQDGQGGLLVPSADPAALSAALQRLLADPALRSLLGRQAQQAVQAYSAEQMCNNYARLMAELLNETR